MSISIKTIYDDLNYPKLPTILKHPYNFLLSKEKISKLEEDLNSYLMECNNKCQMVHLLNRPIKYGILLRTWVLSYSEKVSVLEWEQIGNDIESIYQKYLGLEAKVYKEPYNLNKKFEIRIEPYIAYLEDKLKVERKK